jgi:hypothetical protein
MYALPMWAPKPHLRCASCGKSRVSGAAGGEMGGKKGRSSGRGGAGVFSVITASI